MKHEQIIAFILILMLIAAFAALAFAVRNDYGYIRR